MEFQPPISPYMQNSYTADYVLIEAPSARDSADPTCTSINDVNIVFYLMYLPERSFDSDTYFEGIRNMMTLDNIKENGQIVSLAITFLFSHLKRTIYVDRTSKLTNIYYFCINITKIKYFYIYNLNKNSIFRSCK